MLLYLTALVPESSNSPLGVLLQPLLEDQQVLVACYVGGGREARGLTPRAWRQLDYVAVRVPEIEATTGEQRASGKRARGERPARPRTG